MSGSLYVYMYVCMYVRMCVCIYVYIHICSPPPGKIYAFVVVGARTKHGNAQKNPRLPTSELTKRCNAQ